MYFLHEVEKWRNKERLRKLSGGTTIAYAGQMLQFSVLQEAIDASYVLNEPVAGSYDSDNHICHDRSDTDKAGQDGDY